MRQAWTFGLSAAVPALISIGWLQYQTEGLFLTYLLDVPAHHPIVGYRLFWLSELEMTRAVGLTFIGDIDHVCAQFVASSKMACCVLEHSLDGFCCDDSS